METLLTRDETLARINERRGVRIPLLKHGGLTLVDAMGSDQKIAEVARCTSNLEATGKDSDRNLVRMLLRHRHSTPTEFVVADFLIECPMDMWRQWVRHRTATINEFSSRYSEVPDLNDTTDPDSWRLQSKSNRQGSSGDFVTEFPQGWKYPSYLHDSMKLESPGAYLSSREQSLHDIQREVYNERLKLGVAKEVARKDLCLSTYTRARWIANLGNILHLLGLRMDPHAQLEIRLYANAMCEILEYLFPVTMQAFKDYRLNAMTLTALDQAVLRNLLCGGSAPYSVTAFMSCQHPDWIEITKCRERDECLAKLKSLGIVRGE